ncbi:MAG: hypothetical protein ABIH90_01890 [Candidatus Aenigmatarchaeota archaeon]
METLKDLYRNGADPNGVTVRFRGATKNRTVEGIDDTGVHFADGGHERIELAGLYIVIHEDGHAGVRETKTPKARKGHIGRHIGRTGVYDS